MEERARAVARHIKGRLSRIGMAYDLDGGGMGWTGRMGLRESGLPRGTRRKTGRPWSMPGRWTNDDRELCDRPSIHALFLRSDPEAAVV